MIANNLIRSTGLYFAKGVNFDGSNDWLSGGGTDGDADGPLWTVSFWMNTSSTLDKHIFENNTGGTSIETVNSGANVRLQGERPGSSAVVFRVTSSAVSVTINDGNWHHVILSIDLSDTGKRHLYIDGVDNSPTWNIYNTAFDLDHAGTGLNVGASSAAGAQKYTGDLADFYHNDAEYIDLSVTTNLRKFINAGGKPVNLGSDGSAPTGTAPRVLLAGDVDSWHLNKAGNGDFTENGALTASSTNPP